MASKLTPRMKNWISQLGVHLAFANKHGQPIVLVTDRCKVKDDSNHSIIEPELTRKQLQLIQETLEDQDWIALAPGKLGAVRAPYQFKGLVTKVNNQIRIVIKEMYCTKPGHEAGFRMDLLSEADMIIYDQSRWPDLNPPVI